MPLCRITLSADDDSGAIRDALLGAATDLIAEGLGKPARSVMVVCETGAMALGGSRAPAAFVEVRSIGGLGEDVNASLAGSLCRLLHETAGVPPDRVFLNFLDVPRTDWGWDGTVFSRR